MSEHNLEILTDPQLFDTQMICEFLSQTYWAEGRTLEQVEATINNSECFGAFLAGKQIGFARVLTDRTVFGYLMDVFILPVYRNRGHAMTLMQYILDFPEFREVQTWLLKTRDAHPLYEQLGFKLVSDPECMMTLKRN